ncbi:hypothetical protein GCM10011309_18320 [Litorimonas cladophorae]|uniref:Uncharacterized protein n=1 Tax=Litorimonas cladophorae TaxID=1220491 RepID=A0A918NHY0_9PROT|nr:hypothetical protein GCM10011309_18320 [Litorimonas cladophorae]
MRTIGSAASTGTDINAMTATGPRIYAPSISRKFCLMSFDRDLNYDYNNGPDRAWFPLYSFEIT